MWRDSVRGSDFDFGVRPFIFFGEKLKIQGEGRVIFSTEGDKGRAIYLDEFLSKEEQDELEQELDSLLFEQEKGVIFGKSYLAPRQVTSYGDHRISYRYSGLRRKPKHDWPSALKRVREGLKGDYNFVLVNRYDGGHHSVDWHDDNEPDLEKQSTIASISIGPREGERDFQLRKKYKAGKEKPTEIVTQRLASGSLLLMEGDLQEKTKHRVPKYPKCKGKRYNLTFRKMKVTP